MVVSAVASSVFGRTGRRACRTGPTAPGVSAGLPGPDAYAAPCSPLSLYVRIRRRRTAWAAIAPAAMPATQPGSPTAGTTDGATARAPSTRPPTVVTSTRAAEGGSCSPAAAPTTDPGTSRRSPPAEPRGPDVPMAPPIGSSDASSPAGPDRNAAGAGRRSSRLPFRAAGDLGPDGDDACVPGGVIGPRPVPTAGDSGPSPALVRPLSGTRGSTPAALRAGELGRGLAAPAAPAARGAGGAP